LPHERIRAAAWDFYRLDFSTENRIESKQIIVKNNFRYIFVPFFTTQKTTDGCTDYIQQVSSII